MPHKRRKRGRKTKLVRSMIHEIAPLVKLCMTQKAIASEIGVSVRTYRRWIKRGVETQKGVEWELVCAVEKAEAGRDKAYLKVIKNAALIGQKPVTETFFEYSPDGKLRSKRVIKTEPPDVATAKWVLERSNPAKWAERRYTKIDMQTRLRAEGWDDTEITKSEAELSTAITEAVKDDS